jgi:c-di-GMP-binding flagellar brake protein YcgR
VWEKIEIVVGEETNTGRYVARIEDFAKEGIIITQPEFIDGGTLLRENCDVAVFVTREDGVYRFHSRISRTKAGTKVTHLLSFPKTVRRVQRRQFVRIELFIPIQYANLSTGRKGKRASGQFKWLQSTIINMSAGGVLMKVPEQVACSDLILLKMDFLRQANVGDTIAGTCRRTFKESKEYYAGIEFITAQQLGRHFDAKKLRILSQSARDFDQTAQNRLASYVFLQQVELRKKGLL